MTAAPSVYPSVFMLPGRNRRLRSGHPWVYSNEIRMSAEALDLEPGAPAVLNRVDGKALGVGTFNPHALIAFRLFSTEADAVLDAAFVEARLRRALALRKRLFVEPFYRLVPFRGGRPARTGRRPLRWCPGLAGDDSRHGEAVA